MKIELNMYLVPLNQNKFAIVDAEGWNKVKHFKWYFKLGYAVMGEHFYIDGKRKTKTIFMHRFLVNTPIGKETDHINQDKLDNRYSNLRVCTKSQNAMNRRKVRGSSIYKGVCWSDRDNKWRASIGVNGKHKSLGNFTTEEYAAIAYNKAARKHFGKFARLNDVKNILL